MDERIQSLERLAALKAEGHLTDSEFKTEKARLLSTNQMLAPDNVMASPERSFSKLIASTVIALLTVGLVSWFWFAGPVQMSKDPANPKIVARPKVSSESRQAEIAPIALPKVAAPCRSTDCRTLEARGWAGIEAGMTVQRAQQASGLILLNDHHYDDVEANCRSYVVRNGPSDLKMLVEDGLVTSIEAWGVDFVTPRGLKIGDKEAKVRKLYSPLRQEPDIYGKPDDKQLFYDVERGRFGLKFSINDGRVSDITVGGSSRAYVEHCL